MNRFRMIALMALPVSVGCYRITVVSGAPGANKQIDYPWQKSLVLGVVAPDEISTKEACPQGIAKFQTERSFLNGLASLGTLTIYSPIRTTITCASGPVPR
jgi:hypothetical protein